MFEFASGISYEQLHRWSVDEPEAFWRKIWQFCELIGEPGETTLFRPEYPDDRTAEFTAAQFFPDAELSVVENLLRRSGPAEALVAINEEGQRTVRSWDELRRRVASLASALKDLGVGQVIELLPGCQMP